MNTNLDLGRATTDLGSMTMMVSQKLSIAKAGGYEVLRWVPAEIAEVGPNDVLVETLYVGVNYADCLVRWGIYESAKKFVGWPITPGFEFAGRVLKVGSEVTRLQVGDRVLGITRFNAYATHVVVPEFQVYKLPPSLSLKQAAAIPAVYMTAYHSLFQIGRLYPRSRILVHSAAGGVGTALCQLAQQAGFHVVGVVGSEKKVASCRKNGASDVFVRDPEGKFWDELVAKYPQGFDAIYDAQGPESYHKSFSLLASSGKLFVYGAHGLMPKSGGRINWLSLAWKALRPASFKPFQMITNNRSVCGFNLSFLFDKREMIEEGMSALLKSIASGELAGPSVVEFPFSEVARAHALIESGQSVGKIVLMNEMAQWADVATDRQPPSVLQSISPGVSI